MTYCSPSTTGRSSPTGDRRVRSEERLPPRLGTAQLGAARLGSARLSSARRGTARRGGQLPGGAGPAEPRCGWGTAPPGTPAVSAKPTTGAASPAGHGSLPARHHRRGAGPRPPGGRGSPAGTNFRIPPASRAGSPRRGKAPPLPGCRCGGTGGWARCSSRGPAAHAPGAGRGAALHARLRLQLRRSALPPPPPLTPRYPGNCLPPPPLAASLRTRPPSLANRTRARRAHVGTGGQWEAGAAAGGVNEEPVRRRERGVRDGGTRPSARRRERGVRDGGTRPSARRRERGVRDGGTRPSARGRPRGVRGGGTRPSARGRPRGVRGGGTRPSARGRPRGVRGAGRPRPPASGAPRAARVPVRAVRRVSASLAPAGSLALPTRRNAAKPPNRHRISPPERLYPLRGSGLPGHRKSPREPANGGEAVGGGCEGRRQPARDDRPPEPLTHGGKSLAPCGAPRRGSRPLPLAPAAVEGARERGGGRARALPAPRPRQSPAPGARPGLPPSRGGGGRRAGSAALPLAARGRAPPADWLNRPLRPRSAAQRVEFKLAPGAAARRDGAGGREAADSGGGAKPGGCRLSRAVGCAACGTRSSGERQLSGRCSGAKHLNRIPEGPRPPAAANRGLRGASGRRGAGGPGRGRAVGRGPPGARGPGWEAGGDETPVLWQPRRREAAACPPALPPRRGASRRFAPLTLPSSRPAEPAGPAMRRGAAGPAVVAS
ncbi:collagen alpha-1(I) chain-like [Colius striatus]|uniref:collagen alpha-1(I) chain-like n=1 Tax=Colius striatus TaxID=57412 RepID=UPI002B1CF04F|nr:collagen alpha-1(I) chain-like [Colius striatus]